MFQSPARSAPATTGKTVLAIFAVLSLLLSIFAVTASPVLADGDDSSEECTALSVNVDAEDPGQSEDAATYTAPADQIVTGVCIKSGEGSFGEKHSALITVNGAVNECYTVAGIGTQTVTVTRTDSSDCHGISHIDVRTDQAPEGEASVSLAKSPDGDAVDAGDAAAFVITVTNDGDAEAGDVMVTDELPIVANGWTVDPAQTTLTSCAITGDPGAQQSLSCGPDTLAASASAQVRVLTTTTFDDCGVLDNEAFVTTENGGSADDTGDITVLCADVSLEKSPDGDAVNAGDAAAFVITLTNNDVGLARGVMVTDELPIVANGWTIDPAQTTLTDCAITGDPGAQQSLSCGPDELAGSASAQVRVLTTTTSDDCGVLDNEAFVTTENDGSDDDTGDITVICEDEETGILEIDKFYCPTEDATNTEFIVFDPQPLEVLRIQGGVEGEQEGCLPGDATFTILNTDTDEEWTDVTLGEDGIFELDLEPGNYMITETSTDEDPAPSATFTIEADHITAVLVLNFEGVDRGQLKLVKLFCDADVDSVTFTIEGGEQFPPSLENCEVGDATFALDGGTSFNVGDDGILFASVGVGSHVLAEVAPHVATSPSFEIVEGEITTIIVVNNEAPNGGVQPGNPPGEGTLGGNPPLPNTAMDLLTGSVPALLALLMLTGLGAGFWVTAAEVRRRR